MLERYAINDFLVLDDEPRIGFSLPPNHSDMVASESGKETSQEVITIPPVGDAVRTDIALLLYSRWENR